jgi:hypothetical protein
VPAIDAALARGTRIDLEDITLLVQAIFPDSAGDPWLVSALARSLIGKMNVYALTDSHSMGDQLHTLREGLSAHEQRLEGDLDAVVSKALLDVPLASEALATVAAAYGAGRAGSPPAVVLSLALTITCCVLTYRSLLQKVGRR